MGRETLVIWMLLLVRERGLELLELTNDRDPQKQEQAVSAGPAGGQSSLQAGGGGGKVGAGSAVQGAAQPCWAGG